MQRPIHRAVYRVLVTILAVLALQSCTVGRTPPAIADHGALHVVALTPNPHGQLKELFGVTGDIMESVLAFDTSVTKLDRQIIRRTGHQRLTILHINDLHNHIVDMTQSGNVYRAARIAKLVKDRRRLAREDESVLFLSAGDDHIGTIFDELLGDKPEGFQQSAAYAVLSAIGLDAAVVGNHEFDKGTGILAKAISQDAAFPVLCSNIYGSKLDLPCYRALIASLGQLRIGLIGFTNPDDIYLHPREDPGLDAAEPLLILGKLLPALLPHVDMIIFLNHLGYGGKVGAAQISRHAIRTDDLAIAQAVSRLTDKPAIVVGGHTHSVLNRDHLEQQNEVDNIAVVQAGEYGKWLGEATLYIDWNGTAWKWKNAAHLIPISGAIQTVGQTSGGEPDYDVDIQARVIDPIMARVLRIYQRIVGRSDNNLDLSPASTAIDRYVGESAMANLITDAVVARSQTFPDGPVDLAAVNATALSGIPIRSSLTYKDLYHALPYADTVYVVALTGRQIEKIIVDNARRIFLTHEFVSGGGQYDPASYLERGFLHFSAGLRYDICVGAAPGKGQVQNLTIAGIPIARARGRVFRLALPSYIAHGRAGWNGGPVGGGLPGLYGYDLKSLATARGHDTGLVLRALLIEHVKAQGGLVGVATGARKDGRLAVLSGGC